jgi:hypothetical protein
MKLFSSQRGQPETDYKWVNIYAGIALLFGVLVLIVSIMDYNIVHENLFGGTAVIDKFFGISTPLPVPTVAILPIDAPSNNPSEASISVSPEQSESSTSYTNPAATQYQNYGWYEHNGQSMQYVNGNWYATPQQGSSANQQNTSQGQSDSSDGISPLIPCTLSYGTAYVTSQQQCTTEQQQNQQQQAQEQQTQQQDQQNVQQAEQQAQQTLQQEEQSCVQSVQEQENNSNAQYNQCTGQNTSDPGVCIRMSVQSMESCYPQ